MGSCSRLGAQFEHKKIHSLKELDRFDTVIITTGAESLQIKELSSFPLKQVKGQVLEIEWPQNIPPLQYPLNSHVYLLMTEGGKSCLAVSLTFEKKFENGENDLETAKSEILPKLRVLYPPLKDAPIVNCFAGVRAVTMHHRPLMQRLSSKEWLLTGMGSKGLLYHALFAKEL